MPFYQQAAAILRGVRAVSSSDIPLGGGAAMAAGSTDEMVRAARNQSLYREVNERIEDLNKRFDAALSAGATWVCECADSRCSEPMELTMGEYEELRSHPNRFAVLPGHVLEKVEHVVDTKTAMSWWRRSGRLLPSSPSWIRAKAITAKTPTPPGRRRSDATNARG